MVHRLLHKLSLTRKCSAPCVSPGMPSSSVGSPLSPDAPLFSSALTTTSPTAYACHSNHPLSLVALPPPDSSPGAGSRRPSQRVNLFKRLLGKQPVPPRLNSPESRPRKAWEREPQEFRFDAGAGARDRRSKDISPEVKSPTSWELHWDCAKTEYRGSMEVRTPVFSSEGYALCELPSPTDMISPLDYRSTYRSITDLRTKSNPSLRGRWNDGFLPTGRSVIPVGPAFPSEYPVNSVSSTNTGEQNGAVSHGVGPLNEEDEPGFPGPPKREREPRPTSLMLRPASSSGPAPQMLSPPPARVSLAIRRGTTPPSRLPPAPPPRMRSRRSTRRTHLPCKPAHAHDVSEPGIPTSLTPEEGLIQLQIRTQHTDSYTPLGYRRSFRHVRELNSRTPPTTSHLPQLSITAAPINARRESLDDAGVRSESEISSTESIYASPSDESEPLSTPPDDTVPEIAISRGSSGPSTASDHPQFSIHAKEANDVSSFLDFDPGTPLSPPTPSPATQSLFSMFQSQLFTSALLRPRGSVDGPTDELHSDASDDTDEEWHGWGVRRLVVPTEGSRIIDKNDCVCGSKARPSPSSPNARNADTRSSDYRTSNSVKRGGGGTSIGCSTEAAQRRRRSSPEKQK